MIAKRLFDLVLTIPGLIVLIPLFVIIAIAIKFSSRGPVFFRQTRVGRFERPFEILKFRSMREDSTGTGLQVTAANDQRITRVGSVLRKTKLDELPQLLNVLMGEMSLVGPRPEVPRYVEHYPDGIRQRVLSVPPGITDFAAIEFRNESEILADADDANRCYIEQILQLKLKYYEKYIAERSLWVDFGLILRTFWAVARR